jgi:hypothetical protein
MWGPCQGETHPCRPLHGISRPAAGPARADQRNDAPAGEIALTVVVVPGRRAAFYPCGAVSRRMKRVAGLAGAYRQLAESHEQWPDCTTTTDSSDSLMSGGKWMGRFVIARSRREGVHTTARSRRQWSNPLKLTTVASSESRSRRSTPNAPSAGKWASTKPSVRTGGCRRAGAQCSSPCAVPPQMGGRCPALLPPDSRSIRANSPVATRTFELLSDDPSEVGVDSVEGMILRGRSWR